MRLDRDGGTHPGRRGAPDTESGALVVGEELRAALNGGVPAVALETSVLAHGLPDPANRSAAVRMEEALRRSGSVPAWTAVLDGKPCVGLSQSALEPLLRRDGVLKLSARDLPVALAKRRTGATTVAAALVLAGAAGLTVFATGGIGGVHRESPYDESADLFELARSSLLVICAGAKSILDLPATFERLESYGVTVVGFRTDVAPGFLTRRTAIRLPAMVESAAEIAALWRARRSLGGPGAVVVMNAPPADHALPDAVVDRAVDEALAEARRQGIGGGAITPYLLAAVERATDGASVRANLALLESNAALAAEVAAAVYAGEANG